MIADLSRTLVASAVLLMTSPGLVRAQRIRAQPTDAVAVAKEIRTTRRVGLVLSLLTQNGDARTTAAERDVIADSLAAIAISDGTVDLTSSEVSLTRNIIWVLGDAGSGQRGGTKYDGATARLVRIAEGAPDYFAAAMSQIRNVAPTRFVLDRLAEAAVGDAGIAPLSAVGMLLSEMGPEGLSKARELYEAGRVTSPGAKRMLDLYASGNGWKGQ